MRETKFRVFHKTREKMYDVFSFCENYVKIKGHNGTIEKLPRNEFEDLMQFIRLKDKNGKEIYELDMCKSKKGNLFIVKYQGAGFKLTQNDGQKVWSSSQTSGIEIIGNIYENPELLK